MADGRVEALGVFLVSRTCQSVKAEGELVSLT